MWAANSASHKRCQLLKLRRPEKKEKNKSFLHTVSSRAAERRRSLTVSPHKQTKKAKELRTRSFPRGTSWSNSLRPQQWNASSFSSFIFIFIFWTSNESLKFTQPCALPKLSEACVQFPCTVTTTEKNNIFSKWYFMMEVSEKHLQRFSVFLQCFWPPSVNLNLPDDHVVMYSMCCLYLFHFYYWFSQCQWQFCWG